MRTSLNEIKLIDDFLTGKLDSLNHAAADYRQQTDPLFMLGVVLHKKILRLVGFYYKEQLKQRLDGLHKQIMTDSANSAYQMKVNDLFKNNRHD